MTGASAPCERSDPRGLAVRVWAITFGYAAISALLVQLVILPHLLPAWHAGSGLLAGGDWVAFHRYAVKRAEHIRTQGWSAFELRPRGNAPIGLASAVYALTWPQPWALIPLNAALHATAAALLFRLLRGFVADWRSAAFGTAPLVLYPSALVWVTQIHKDGFFIAGYLCLLAAWAHLARQDHVAENGRALLPTLLLLPVGFGLIWLVRPELMIMAHAAAALALGVLGARIAVRIWREPARWRRSVTVLALVVLATFAGAWATSGRSPLLHARATVSALARPGAADRVVRTSDLVPSWDEPKRGVRAIPWYRSSWLPAAVDQTAYQIALVREVFHIYFLDAHSNMDIDVGFYRATDLLRYLPRALQIALLAPFPTQWLDTGSLGWTTVGRRAVALEMLGVYAALLALLPVVWRWRHRADLWIVIFPCLLILSIYSLSIPNLGALHRFRYGFIMVLIGLGLAGTLDRLARPRPRRSEALGEPARPPTSPGPRAARRIA